MANSSDNFIELHRHLEDQATADVALNLHKRIAALEAQGKVANLIFALLRWAFGGASLVAVAKVVLDVVVK